MKHKRAAIDICNWVASHGCDLGGRKLVLFLRQRDLNLLIQQRDRFLDMVDQDGVEGFGEERDAHFVGKLSVYTVGREVQCLGLKSGLDSHTIDDVLLRAALDAIVSQLERIHRAIKKLERVCALIHEVDFCEHANCAVAIRIHFLGNLERVRVGEVDVGG